MIYHSYSIKRRIISMPENNLTNRRFSTSKFFCIFMCTYENLGWLSHYYDFIWCNITSVRTIILHLDCMICRFKRGSWIFTSSGFRLRIISRFLCLSKMCFREVWEDVQLSNGHPRLVLLDDFAAIKVRVFVVFASMV